MYEYDLKYYEKLLYEALLRLIVCYNKIYTNQYSAWRQHMPQKNDDSELILGLISTVGTNVESVISILRDQLGQFHYDTELITVSQDVLPQFSGHPVPTDEYGRVEYFMDLGNRIRKETEDSSILMKGVASFIYERRMDTLGNAQPRKRVAYIVKSIKHPDEVMFMRDTYGDGFHLIGINSSRERRLKYLMDRKSIPFAKAEALLNRDANETEGHGQHTQAAFQHSDYFIEVTDSADGLQNSVARLVDLLFGNPFISPSFDEYAMFMAYATSLRSADLSRQIGAVIAKDNEVIASGTNDCAKYGGGLYWPEKNDQGAYVDAEYGRDYKIGVDSNKQEQRKIIDSILGNLDQEATEENVNRVKAAGIGDLTEYGRVVHGEMETLLMCSRNNISCRNADLFATTFPCHNCAKHIIAAGIKRVVYIEPYPKSKAFEFYRGEITDDINEDNKVVFTPFVGVGPHRFIDLFAVSSTKWYARTRKDDEGKKISWERDKATLRNPMAVFTYIDSEKAALTVFEEETSALKECVQDGSEK